MGCLSCLCLLDATMTGYPSVQPIAHHNDAIPRVHLGKAERNFFKSHNIPIYLEDKGRPTNPFPYPCPMAGKNGGYAPGSQYERHPPDLGPHHPEHHTTLMSSSFKQLERERELSVPRYRVGHGYVGNLRGSCDVCWSRNEQLDTFRTTYQDDINTGYCAPRTFSLIAGRRIRKQL